MRTPLTLLALLAVAACGGPDGETDAAVADSGLDSGPLADAALDLDAGRDASLGVDAFVADSGSGCAYPSFVEPMMADEGIAPYRWPEAIAMNDGRNIPLDLSEAFCTADENIDWSPFDVLVFVAIPGW